MDNFAFLLVTYKNDFIYAKRLVETYCKYNIDNLPLYIVLPSADEEEFDTLLNICDKKISILAQEVICPYLVTESIGDIQPGYINQEILKLSFWETNLCNNYFCLDSDGMFIREFYVSDFMYDAEIPYTVLFEDNDLKADPLYYKIFWKQREESLRKIQQTLGMSDKRLLTCHGFQVFSSKVLEHLKNNFMKKQNYSYKDLLAIAPYEFSWYNFYLQKEKVIPIYFCDPIFKCFHMGHQHLLTWIQGVTLDDLARSYVGIVIQSNFSRKNRLPSYDDVGGYISILPPRRMLVLVKLSCLSYFRYFRKGVRFLIKKIMKK